jgi:hypothetical protein
MASPRDLRVLDARAASAAQYAVMKHQMINGDIWVRCLRCGRTWQSASREELSIFDEGRASRLPRRTEPSTGQQFDEERSRTTNAAIDVRRRTTRCRHQSSAVSHASTLNQGRLIDAADTYRENIASTNLR